MLPDLKLGKRNLLFIFIFIIFLFVLIALAQKLRLLNKIDKMKYCNEDSDCVPVSCSCYCSGCGGFPYEDVINKKYVAEWYHEKNCDIPKVCLMVCCPPRKVVCENHRCKVMEIKN